MRSDKHLVTASFQTAFVLEFQRVFARVVTWCTCSGAWRSVATGQRSAGYTVIVMVRHRMRGLAARVRVRSGQLHVAARASFRNTASDHNWMDWSSPAAGTSGGRGQLMDDRQEALLPGSHVCVGCGGLTFRQREDALCPRCAFEAESLIERIELDGLDRDLQLITEFDAYYRQREEQKQRFQKLGGPVFGRRPTINDPAQRESSITFVAAPFWANLRDAG